jgi:NAD(P)-dependent dehydrogenase (short-subunit alcohol dehydrogenase family)
VEYFIPKGESMTTPARLETIAVIGNGIIGHGIAQVFAMSGKDVLLIGRRNESLACAIDNIRKSLEQFQSHGLITEEESINTVNRIRTSTNLGDADVAQLVIEAIYCRLMTVNLVEPKGLRHMMVGLLSQRLNNAGWLLQYGWFIRILVFSLAWQREHPFVIGLLVTAYFLMKCVNFA